MTQYKILLFPFKRVIKLWYFFFSRIEFYFKNIFKTKINVLLPPTSSLIEKDKKVIAIFAIYQPKGLAYLIRRSINYLTDNGIQLIVVAPHAFNEEEVFYLQSKKCIILTRENIGRDFGSYKYGVLYLLSNLDLLNRYEKILLVNDSIIFPLKENEKNLEKILYSPHKVIGLVENYQYNWHICSYFILFKKEFFIKEEIKYFWKRYKPYNSRLHAIHQGEIRLSKIIRNLTDDYFILYSGEQLFKNLKKYNQIAVDLISKRSLENESQFKLGSEFLIRDISKLIENSSPAHTLGLFLIHYLDCFFIKKDICYRNCYPLSYVVGYISQINDNLEFLASLSTEFRNKKLFVSLDAFQKLLYYCGVI